ncbi:MAG: hypothetical protein ACYDBB_02110 [Armatimonadota bacterium]
MAQELNIVGKSAALYEKKPILRSLLSLIPGWSVADTLLQQRAQEIKIDRLHTFFDELANGKNELTEDQIQSEDFLHCFFSTVRAVINTRQREKIRMFARLLNASSSSDSGVETDGYEENLSILDEISLREFAILNELYMYEQNHPFEGKENEVQNTWKYWSDFQHIVSYKYSLDDEEFKAFMMRTERTGCYRRMTGANIDYDGDMGRTTPIFHRFLQSINK